MLKSKLRSDLLVAQRDLETLADILDCIPLALSHAAAYIHNKRILVAKYIAMFEESELTQAKLLESAWNDIRRDREVPDAVIATLRISLLQIEATLPLAMDILSLAAMMDRQRIPEDLLLSPDGDELRSLEALGLLQEYSMLNSLSGPENEVGMHRLVQICTRVYLKSNGKLSSWEAQAHHVLARQYAEFPDDPTHGQLLDFSLLRPHALRVLQFQVKESDGLSRSSPSILHWFASICYRPRRCQYPLSRSKSEIQFCLGKISLL